MKPFIINLKLSDMKRIFLSFFISLLFVMGVKAQTDPKPPLSDYVGRYVFPEGSVVPDVTVALNGEALSMTSAAGSSALTEQGRDSFTIVEFSGVAYFKSYISRSISLFTYQLHKETIQFGSSGSCNSFC